MTIMLVSVLPIWIKRGPMAALSSLHILARYGSRLIAGSISTSGIKGSTEDEIRLARSAWITFPDWLERGRISTFLDSYT